MLKDRKEKLALLFGAALVLMPALAMSQTMTVETVNGSTSATSVAVPWTLEVGNGLQGANFEIAYDNALFTPDTENCLSGVTSQVSSCQVETVGGTDIVIIGVLNFAGALAANQSGVITFSYTPGIAADTYPLTVTEVTVNTVPAGTAIAVNSGAIVLQDLAPALSLNPIALTFTAQQGTTSAAQQVVATNSGNLDGLIFDSFDFGGGGFAQNNNCPTAAPGLAIGASCTINIEFAPPAAGDFSTNFTVVTTNGGTGVVAITATGTLGPQSALSVSGPLDFGSIDLNDLPDTGTITATNTGDAGSSLAISAVNYAGDAAFAITNNGCAGAAGTLAQNQSCAVEVSFNTAAAGNYTGTVSFTSNAATNPTPSASVLGTATATANISVNPPFGPVNLGTGEAGETLTVNGTLTNTGSAAAEVACVLNDASGVFSTAPSPLNATVNANSTVPFALSCALPTAGEQGDAFAATLTCSVDGQEAGVHQLACDITDFVPVPVPTMSSWSIALFALLMLLVGGFSIRMFRIQ